MSGRSCRIGAVLLVAMVLLGGGWRGARAQEERDASWVELFNGRDLTGWRQLGGEAEYRVEEGAIVGTTVAGTRNSFLATEESYGDFVLRLEFKVEGEVNSGIQVRSLRRAGSGDGTVHGYQVEIDPSPRAWTAGIYEEGGREWLFPMEVNPRAQAAFRPGEWNRVEVECLGPTIKTWLNGVPASYLVDGETARGLIALQVHSAMRREQVGQRVLWRKIRIRTGELVPRSDAFPFVVNHLPNRLVSREEELGWRLAWDGETGSGWRGVRREEFPGERWRVEKGTLTVAGEGTGGAARNSLVTNEEYDAFELQLEFLLREGGNSGIKYLVRENHGSGGDAVGLEYQILDDARHPDLPRGRGDTRTLASLYDLLPARKEARFVHPAGEWNHARIVVRRDGEVEHWLNHRKVLHYDRHSPEFLERVKGSKYENVQGFGRWPAGHVLLQDHGDPVSFRSIKIRRLD